MYLLPCRCGEQTVVEPCQAGETAVCLCGALLSSAQHVGNDLFGAVRGGGAEASAGAGDRAAADFSGATLMVLAVVAGAWMFVHRPISRFSFIDPDEIRRSSEHLPPPETWETWQTMKQGLDRRTDEWYATGLRHFYIWEGAAGAGVAGRRANPTRKFWEIIGLM